MRKCSRKKVKFIAFYLPQFHEIEENNKWWGKGYTEWTSVMAALPLYRGHEQPRVPYRNNYYNLLNKDIMMWQSKISMQAGINGFCFYHYWFKGKKVLEKPIENYLKWKDIPQQFCLSWANDSWVRSWSNVQGTIWNSKIEKDVNVDHQNNGLLIEQDYGDQNVWKEHFDYLIEFFLDERYIKIDNKPLFLIHRPESIKRLTSMILFWNKLSHQYGFDGIHVVVTNPIKIYREPVCGCVYYEPARVFDYKPIKRRIYESVHVRDEKKLVRRYSYTNLWIKILKSKPNQKMKTYLGAFVGYDDSPRRGYQGYIVKGNTPLKFQIFMQLLMKKWEFSEQYGEFIFITAWNEWAEGAYLEPDKKSRYEYLKALQKVKRG